MQRFQFHSRTQKPGETVAAFTAELRQLSEFCEFGETVEDTYDRLVCGTASSAIHAEAAVGRARPNVAEGSEPRSSYWERGQECEGLTRTVPAPCINHSARCDSSTRSVELETAVGTHGRREDTRHLMSSVRRETLIAHLTVVGSRPPSVIRVRDEDICPGTKKTQSAATGPPQQKRTTGAVVSVIGEHTYLSTWPHNRGGFRILCKGGPHAQNSDFSLIIHDYVTALPLLGSR